ncbi:hypothetical protein HKD37_14G040369 [Glycine soja]
MHEVSDLLDYREPSSRVFLFDNILLLVVPTAEICSSKGMIPLETIKRDMTTLGIITKSPFSSLPFKIKALDVTSLKELGRLMGPLQMQAFHKVYGKILDLTIAEIFTEAVVSLTQYYDQPLRCFTFGDFQLVPTIEEFEEILGCPLGGRKPYFFSGFLPSLSKIAVVVRDLARELDHYLESKARDMANQEEWVPFVDVLTLLIFGVVLFPNVDGLVDLAAIDAFLAYHHSKENLVVAILANLFDTFDRRCEKSSTRIICCLPALCVWLVSHLFQQDIRNPCPLRSHRLCVEKRRVDWDQHLARIGGRTINWFPRWKEGKEGVLFSCGDYPNIPLIGTRGCINYNPALAIRQLGNPMRGAPAEESLSPFLMRDFGVQSFKIIQKAHKNFEAPEEDEEVRALKTDLGKARLAKEKFNNSELKLRREERDQSREHSMVLKEELAACSRSKRNFSQCLCETETNMLAIISKYQEELNLATTHEHKVADEYARVYAEKEARERQMASMMDAMLGMRQLMENNVVTAAAISSAAEADPTLPTTVHHPLPNVVGREKSTLGHISNPHLGYNRVAYPYGLPPNYTPPVMHDDAGHVPSPILKGEPPRQSDELVGYMPSSFADLVFAGERIEVGLKRGKFDYVSSTSTNARRIGETRAKRKEGDTHVVTSVPAWIKPPQTSNRTHQYAQHHPSFSTRTGDFSNSAPREAPQAPTPTPNRPASDAHFGVGSNAIRNFPPWPTLEFTPIPMTYEDLLPSLIANQMVVISPGKIYQPPFPKWYNPDATCAYHGKTPGHSTEKCLALKYKVQLNAVESGRPRRSKPLKNVTTPQEVYLRGPTKGGLGDEGSEEQHICIQSADEGSFGRPKPLVVYFTRDAAPQTPRYPSVVKLVSFPYKNNHAVPRRYAPPSDREEEASDISSLSAKVTNITGLSGVTCSGRVFAPPYLPTQPANVKGNAKITQGQDDKIIPTSNENILVKGLPEKNDGCGKKKVLLEEAGEFLCIIQQIEFKVIEQLNKTLARVSLLELLMSSEPHRALQVVSIASIDSFSGQPCLSDTAMMVARVMLGNGYEPGMGLGKNNGGRSSLVSTRGNRGKFGLGYKPTQANIRKSVAERKSGSQGLQLGRKVEEGPPCHISRSFISAGLGHECQVVAICKDDSTSGSDLVRPCPPGFRLGNWRVEERPDIYGTSIM